MLSEHLIHVARKTFIIIGEKRQTPFTVRISRGNLGAGDVIVTAWVSIYKTCVCGTPFKLRKLFCFVFLLFFFYA